ncbi:hypothetical protein [Bremerella alba]|uniref:Uncharacterized protein n=1 Tax=Bremerella alba TaxID=980252 RepID=A0A7V8VAI2_9BACT|nr:hypothetical protein [Bremerella alba]MBA2117931.1 hypothetical protein [Bremerella alba]
MSNFTKQTMRSRQTDASQRVPTPIADRAKQLFQDLQQEIRSKQQEIDRLQTALARRTETTPDCAAQVCAAPACAAPASEASPAVTPPRIKKRRSIVKAPVPMRIKPENVDQPATTSDLIRPVDPRPKTTAGQVTEAARPLPQPCQSGDTQQSGTVCRATNSPPRLCLTHPDVLHPSPETEPTSADSGRLPPPRPTNQEAKTAGHHEHLFVDMQRRSKRKDGENGHVRQQVGQMLNRYFAAGTKSQYDDFDERSDVGQFRPIKRAFTDCLLN